MHCEWVVLVGLVRFDEPVTGPPPWSPEVLPRVFSGAGCANDAPQATGRTAHLPSRHAIASPSRNDAKPLASTDPVGLEVIVVHREDGRERLAFGEQDERGIGKVHRPVVIAIHQPLERTEIFVANRPDRHGPGADEVPGGSDVSATRADQVEEPRQDSSRGQERGARVIRTR